MPESIDAKGLLKLLFGREVVDRATAQRIYANHRKQASYIVDACVAEGVHRELVLAALAVLPPSQPPAEPQPLSDVDPFCVVALTDLVATYVWLQQQLLAAHRVEADRIGIPFPADGTVMLDGDAWDFDEHGGGVNFVRRRDSCTVDAHERIDRPRAVDPWRLYLFGRHSSISAFQVDGQVWPMEHKDLIRLLPPLMERHGAPSIYPNTWEWTE